MHDWWRGSAMAIVQQDSIAALLREHVEQYCLSRYIE